MVHSINGAHFILTKKSKSIIISQLNYYWFQFTDLIIFYIGHFISITYLSWVSMFYGDILFHFIS